MRSVLVLIALLFSANLVWAERGQENERSLQWDAGKKQNAPQRKKKPAPLGKAWWKAVGDPAIYAFRDCAVARVTTVPDATSPGYKAGDDIFRACSKEFDYLYGVLFSGYGDHGKVKAAFDKISENIVLPALDDAIKRRHAAEADQQTIRDGKSKAALNQLFDCGVESSRRLASATSENAETVATAVLSRCSPFLTDYIDLEATTYAQRQELEQYVVEKFRPFVIQHIVEARAGIQPPADKAAPEEAKGSSSGTGFFVTRDGNVLTNHHVISGCSSINVIDGSGQRFGAMVRNTEAANDLALLRAFTKTNMVATFRPAEAVRAGEDVVVFGYPYSGLLTSSGNVVTGSVTALQGMQNDERFFQVSAPLQPGNSGGALLDRSGNVIGIVQSKLNAINVAVVTGDIPQNVNFAIKGSIATDFLAANGIRDTGAPLTGIRDVPTIAEGAKDFSVRIVCEKP
jgi:S1-C subfamily serine protease